MMNRNLRKIGKRVYLNNPSLRPYIDFLRRKKPDIPKFSGWGMTSIHEFPWKDDYQGKVFRKTCQDIKNEFDFGDGKVSTSIGQLDSLQWRHWNISYAVRFALRFTNSTEFNFVECGVANGITSFFLLSETDAKNDLFKKCSLHLYDSWDEMKLDYLVESEKDHKGRYKGLDIKRTEKNLSKFKTLTIFHKGYIPESLSQKPEAPKTICYLHIDLNSSKPTLSALEFFYPRLVSGGVIIFDDYAATDYDETKQVIDKFFSNKPGILQKIPTGQGLYYHR